MIVVFFLYGCGNNDNSNTVVSEHDKRMIAFINQLKNDSKLILTKENLETYKKGLESKGVQSIRVFINKFRKDEGAIGVNENVALDEIKKVNPQQLEGKFGVVAVDSFLLGGEIITIIFNNPDNSLFYV